MKKVQLIFIVILFLFSMSGCLESRSQKDKSITISAASSLKEVLTEIQTNFEKENNLKLTFNFASSGTLQRQIEEGAPADIFLSAGKNQMEELENKNLIDKTTLINILTNKLVLVVPKEYKDNIKTASDLANSNIKVSIGEPESVPAGQYAKESLVYLKLYESVRNRLIYAKDVKQVAAYVEKGEAAGIVYKSDALILKNSIMVQAFQEASHEPIVYPAAILLSSKNKEQAKVFIDYLNTDKAKEIFKKYGFDVKEK